MENTIDMKSARFAVKVQTGDSDAWTGNGVRFETAEAAKDYAIALHWRWNAVTAWKVIERLDDGAERDCAQSGS
jgi:hypothetical protein